jgi:hypothetical protein
MLKSVTGKTTTPGYWDKEGKAKDTHRDTDFSGHQPPECWRCGKELWPDGTCSGCRPPTNLFREEATA